MDRYSRTITILKVALPLAAVGLLSTLFLLSRQIDPDAVLPFAERDIADRLRNQQITAPTFSGTSANGDDVFLTAAKVSPPIAGRPARAVDLQARIMGSSGETVNMRARKGAFQDTLGTALFDGGVRIETSAGYVLETEALEADLNQVTALAPGQVTGHGPPGDFTAGAMELQSEADGGGLHIVFKNGVRLLYDPQKVER